MAELNSSTGSPGGKSRTSTLSPRVDMTPMVDLMFLLITFFMLTTTLTKQAAMQVAMPVGDEPGPVSAERTLNICLGKTDRIEWYMGNDEHPLSTPTETNFSAKGLRAILKEHILKAKQDWGKNLIVLVKPSDKSSYKNLVDALDELAITGVQNYMIVDTSPRDIDRMTQHTIY